MALDLVCLDVIGHDVIAGDHAGSHEEIKNMTTNEEDGLLIDGDTGEIIENLAYEHEGEEDDLSVYMPKMTVATMEGLPERCKIAKGPVVITTVWSGQVSEHKIVRMPRQDGGSDEYVALVGRFKAERYDGKLFRSGISYLPGGLHELVLERLAIVKTNSPKFGGARGVEFAYRITAEPDTNPRGYSYRGESLTKVAKSDPIEQLFARAKARSERLALPAPEVRE